MWSRQLGSIFHYSDLRVLAGDLGGRTGVDVRPPFARLPSLGHTIRVGDSFANEIPPPKPRQIEHAWETEALRQPDVITGITEACFLSISTPLYFFYTLLHIYMHNERTANDKQCVGGPRQLVQGGGEEHPRDQEVERLRLRDESAPGAGATQVAVGETLRPRAATPRQGC